MKKLFALLLAMMLVFSLAACGDNNTTDPDKDNSVTSQNEKNENDNETNTGTSQSEDQAGTENQGGEETSSDEIMVKNISMGYDTNENYAFVVISFARPNKENITFAHPDGSAITLGNSYVLPDGSDYFSITDGFEVTGVTVDERSVTVNYTATYEEFNQIIPSITYTPSSDPLIKTTSDETVDGFTYKAGYTNFDLYE